MSKLIKVITSVGYGYNYTKNEKAPQIIREQNLDVVLIYDGQVKVWPPNLQRYE
jgi:hypothetical protein